MICINFFSSPERFLIIRRRQINRMDILTKTNGNQKELYYYELSELDAIDTFAVTKVRSKPRREEEEEEERGL